MIEEMAILLWSRELHKALMGVKLGQIDKVLTLACALGTPIPPKHLIDALGGFFPNPPSDEECREALKVMKLIPSSA